MKYPDLFDCKCILILANKQDESNAMSVEEISKRLDLKRLEKETGKKCKIIGCYVSKDSNCDQFYKGFDWIRSQIVMSVPK